MADSKDSDHTLLETRLPHALPAAETSANNERGTDPGVSSCHMPRQLEMPTLLETNEEDWIEQFVEHVLNEIPPGDTSFHEYSDLHNRLTSALEKVRDDGVLPSQSFVDELYSLMVSHILQGSTIKKASRCKVRGQSPDKSKRKQKCYIYGRTQELYKKNPGILAKYIREGTLWLDDRKAVIPNETICEFYSMLWGKCPDIIIPFDGNSDAEMLVDMLLCAITKKEVTARFNRLKHGIAPGSDGIEKKHIGGTAAREVIRLFFNLIFICRLQPSAWSRNRTILLPKPEKDPDKIENYRPLTISSILCRMYWGIIDHRLRGNTSFTCRQKGFVSEPGCFNNVQALAEILRATKAHRGMVLIQLDISKAFDSIPHQAVDPALQRLGVPSAIRSSILNSY
jgi:hypothetical protein